MALTKVSYSLIKDSAISVVDFGATGDGTTDDSVAIQAALNTGKDVFFPKGTYRANNLSITNNNVCVFSDGNAIIKFNATNGTQPIMAVSGDNVEINNLIFDANNEQPKMGMLILSEGIENPIVSGCVFQNMYGTLTGAVVLNQKYAIVISNADVNDFVIESCKFYNLTTLNDGSIVAQTIGFGFVGGIIIGLNASGTTDSVVSYSSRGIIRDCSFDTIRTDIGGSPTVGYDDADAIRAYGGAAQYKIQINDCIFRNCSKRAIKCGSPGLSINNITVYATGRMVTVVKTHPDTYLEGLNFYGDSSAETLVLIQHEQPESSQYTYSNLFISNVYGQYVNRFLEIAPADATAIWRNVNVQNIYIDQISGFGFTDSGTGLSATRENCVLKDCTLIGDNSGLKAYASLFNDINNMTVVNGEVYHRKGIIRNLTIRFTDPASYTPTGLNASYILDIGDGTQAENITVNLTDLPTSYMTATTNRLVYIHDDNTTVKNIKIISNQNYDGTTYAMCDIGAGDYMVVDGLTHQTTTSAQARIYVGFVNSATTNVAIANAQRIGTGTANEFFWLGGSNVDKVIFRNIDDFGAVGALYTIRNTTSATDIYAAGVTTKSSTGATTGVTTTDSISI